MIERETDAAPDGEEHEALPPKLSTVLERLRDEATGSSWTVEQLQNALGGRGASMLLLFLTLPFCFVPVPGLSAPIGMVVLLLGVRIACSQPPLLPKFVRRRTLSAGVLQSVLRCGGRFTQLMEKLVRPRMHFLHEWPGALNLIGVGIALGGLMLALPLPIPFSNMVPAWGVVLLTAGSMERDGLAVLLGHAVTLLAWALLVCIWIFGFAGIRKLTAFAVD